MIGLCQIFQEIQGLRHSSATGVLIVVSKNSVLHASQFCVVLKIEECGVFMQLLCLFSFVVALL